MFNFLESHLTMMINKEVKRPSKFPEAPAPEPRIPVAMSVDSMEEEKVPPESPKNYDASGYSPSVGVRRNQEKGGGEEGGQVPRARRGHAPG